MEDIKTRLSALRRPRLLVRAARLGAQNYCRNRDLRRLIGYGSLPRPAAVALKLLEMEDHQNRKRLAAEAEYSLIRHVDILIALVGEAALLTPSST